MCGGSRCGIVTLEKLRREGDAMSVAQVEDIGPIDYIILEWPERQPTGEVAPMIRELVDRGIIRVLDVAFVSKAHNGAVTEVNANSVGADASEFGEFAGAASGLLGSDDLDAAAEALEPGTSAAVLVWENRWAAPIAAALRRSGGQLVDSGRIPVQAIIASLDALETAT
jgi:hypothetical protein